MLSVSISKIYITILSICLLWLLTQLAYAKDAIDLKTKQNYPVVKVGVLKSGSANWELTTLKNNNFDKKNFINVQKIEYGSVNALLIALKSKAVDFIVSDWIWVAKQFNKKPEFYFYPFSSSSGGMFVAKDDNYKSIKDLENKKLGVAGGVENKSWLLLKSYVSKKYNIKLEKFSKVRFAAPPLVNVLLKRGRLDLGFNFWHFNAKLDETRFKQILNIKDILKYFEIDTNIPMLGWVFHSKWADENPDLATRFLNSSYQTKNHLKENDKPWDDLKSIIKAKHPETLVKLKNGFIKGIPPVFNKKQIIQMSKLFQIIKNTSNDKKLKQILELPKSIFWQKHNNSKTP